MSNSSFFIADILKKEKEGMEFYFYISKSYVIMKHILP